MQAARIHERGGANGLVVEDAPHPHAATGDVIVEVRATGLVPDELDWPGTWVDRAGRDRVPSIPGHEVSGVVTDVEYGTAGLSVGDRVCGLTDWHRDGAAAEYVAVEARNLTRIPPALDDIRAAALPIAGLTAWQGLFVHGRLTAGRTVLVHGGAGGTGSLAVQLAHDAGARVIATGRRNAEELAVKLGADTFVDLDRTPFEDVAGAVDLVFDTIGGDVLERSAAIVKPGGALVSITAPPPLVPQDGHATFFIVEPHRDQLGELVQMVEQGRIVPHVGGVYPLPDARHAFLAKQQGVAGKVVIEVPSS